MGRTSSTCTPPPKRRRVTDRLRCMYSRGFTRSGIGGGRWIGTDTRAKAAHNLLDFILFYLLFCVGRPYGLVLLESAENAGSSRISTHAQALHTSPAARHRLPTLERGRLRYDACFLVFLCAIYFFLVPPFRVGDVVPILFLSITGQKGKKNFFVQVDRRSHQTASADVDGV